MFTHFMHTENSGMRDEQEKKKALNGKQSLTVGVVYKQKEDEKAQQ